MDFAFDQDTAGRAPSGWRSGVTGKGSPVWEVRPDPTAPSKPNVLHQSGSGTFFWIVRPDVSLENGRVAVKFKPLAGKQDQAGGVVWRWKDGDNYVPANTWHTLAVEFSGSHISVALNGKVYIEMEDAHIRRAGAVGLWTKADSVTAFDDFSYSVR